jgi:DNA-binding beta-propeller fold protein YncE
MSRAVFQFASAASAALGATAAIWVLAGCAGGNSSPVAPTAARVAQPSSVGVRSSEPRMDVSGCGKLVIYATSYNLTVEVYNQLRPHPTPCGSITGLHNPQGLFVDRQQNLWVVDQGNGPPHHILEFAPGNPTPVLTLVDTTGYPVDVAVDNVSGTVYVTNFFSNGSTPGAVLVYPKGSTTPTATLTDPNMQYAFYDAVDNQGNLYVTYLHTVGSFGTGHVFEWFGGTGTPTDLGIALQAPGGIATTKTGALLICDQQARACGDFAPGSTTMTGIFAKSDKDPFAIALDKDEDAAYVNDAGASNGLGIWHYPGPDTRAAQKLQVPGMAYAGIAASPAAPNGLPY